MVTTGQAADLGELPGRVLDQPVVREAPEQVPSQTLTPAVIRITRIKPDCMVSGRSVRIVGRGFGSVQGTYRARIGAHDIAIRQWRDHTIDGRLPGHLKPGDDYTIAVLDGQGKVVARGRTRACEKPAPVIAHPQSPSGERSAPVLQAPPLSDADRVPTPPPMDGKALLEHMKERHPTRPEIGRVSPPIPGTAPPSPAKPSGRPSLVPPTPHKPSLPTAQQSDIAQPALPPRKELGVAVAPRQRDPVPHQPSGFGEAVTRMKQATSAELVGGVELRINGAPGPEVPVVAGHPIDVSWSMVTQVGERVDGLWLVVRESALTENVCEGNPESSYPQIPVILGDGAQVPAAPTGRGTLNGLTTDTRYYLRLCARTDVPGEGLAWRGVSNPVTLHYGRVVVRTEGSDTGPELQDLTRDLEIVEVQEVVRHSEYCPGQSVQVLVRVRNNGRYRRLVQVAALGPRAEIQPGGQGWVEPGRIAQFDQMIELTGANTREATVLLIRPETTGALRERIWRDTNQDNHVHTVSLPMAGTVRVGVEAATLHVIDDSDGLSDGEWALLYEAQATGPDGGLIRQKLTAEQARKVASGRSYPLGDLIQLGEVSRCSAIVFTVQGFDCDGDTLGGGLQTHARAYPCLGEDFPELQGSDDDVGTRRLEIPNAAWREVGGSFSSRDGWQPHRVAGGRKKFHIDIVVHQYGVISTP